MRSLLALALAACLAAACRTPWSVEPLPVETLETGMHPEVVRYLLGTPKRAGSDPETGLPVGWPWLRASPDIHPTEAWHYEDQKLDRMGLAFAGLALPLVLPLHLVGVALRLDESERDCLWLEEREIDLYFEDERLAEWVVTLKPEPDWCQGDPGWQPPRPWEPPFGSGWPVGNPNRRRGGC